MSNKLFAICIFFVILCLTTIFEGQLGVSCAERIYEDSQVCVHDERDYSLL